MSRTLRRSRRPSRATLLCGAAVAVLSGCGGSADPTAESSAESSAGSSASSSASDTAGASDAADFCSQADGIDDRVDAALDDADDDIPSVPDAFAQIAVELRGIDAPAAIAADWEAMAAGLDRMGQAFSDLDITDADSLEALDAAEGDLSSASSRVEDYLRDECGINP